MNLKMNSFKKNRLSTLTKSNHKPNGSLGRKINRISRIKIKEEISSLSEDEFISPANTENSAIKVEKQDEDMTFEDDSNIPPSYGIDNHYASSPSGSENSSQSPSPSPPLTSQPKITTSLTSVSSTAAPNYVQKSSQSLILNRLPTSMATKGGSPMTNILLIDSRPYQLIPQVETNTREVHHVQLRVVPSQQQQQPQIQKQLPLLAPLPLPQSPSHGSSAMKTISTPLLASNLKVRSDTFDRSNSVESVYTPDDTEEEGSSALDGAAAGSEIDYQSDSGLTLKGLDSHDSTPTNSQDSNYPLANSDCPIPNLLNEHGVYDFQVLLDAKEDTLKTPTWLVSGITKKLYTNMNKPIPFRVVLKKHYPKKRFFLRAMAVFKYPMFLRQNVLRCPNHLNPQDSTNVDFPFTKHVIRADHPRAIYDSSSSGRLSVVVPLDFPETRSEGIPVLLKFMCHNSCVGGINRRPMAILLALEHNEEEVGRYTIEVRVCACPSRDVKTEEKQLIAKGLCSKSGHTYENRRNRKRPRNEDLNLTDEDEEIFHLPVRGAVLFNYLKEMKLLYLKHHPEYARRYPDIPNDAHLSRLVEELGHQESLTDMGEEIRPPDSPQDLHDSSAMEEKLQPMFLLYSNNREMLPSNIVKDRELNPEVRKSLGEHFQSSKSFERESSPRKSLPVFIKREKSGGGFAEEDEDESLFGPISQLGTPNGKQTKRKSRTPNGRQKGMSSPRSHLQVPVMPEKHKGLMNVVPMPKGKDDGVQQHMRARAGSEECDKVMLAAQVLASHLGSQQLDK